MAIVRLVPLTMEISKIAIKMKIMEELDTEMNHIQMLIRDCKGKGREVLFSF
jgi:hypothetical protein